MTSARWSEGAAGPLLAILDAELNGYGEELSWQDRALCAETDPEAFFPEKGGSTREAKAVCMACEVRAQCLEYALEFEAANPAARYGIWGGKSERERRKLRHETEPAPAARPAA
jgi:WhiB family redox-sensing transcriptional regulator